MNKIFFLILLPLCIAGVSGPVAGQQFTAEEMEEWLFDDSESLIDDVNEGELVFLEKPPVKTTHHHHNSLTITDSSVEDGWVQLEQCHKNLDVVGLAQIMFRPGRTRDLRVSKVRNIDVAYVQGSTVQLENVGNDALLCINAEVRIFAYNGDGTFSLLNGPYLRRFLDGYYPMHVTLDVKIDSDRLRYYQSIPSARAGFKLWRSARAVHYETWFEGTLNTEIQFHDLVIGNRDDSATRGKVAKVKHAVKKAVD